MLMLEKIYVIYLFIAVSLVAQSMRELIRIVNHAVYAMKLDTIHARKNPVLLDQPILLATTKDGLRCKEFTIAQYFL